MDKLMELETKITLLVAKVPEGNFICLKNDTVKMIKSKDLKHVVKPKTRILSSGKQPFQEFKKLNTIKEI